MAEGRRAQAKGQLGDRWPTRSIWLLIAAAAMVLSALAVQAWVAQNGGPSLAAYEPTLTPTPPATAMPRVTPTLAVLEYVAQQLPHLKQAWDARDWETATRLLNDITLLDSKYPGLRAARCDTYLHWAYDLERQCQIKEAYALYRQAGSVCEDPAAVQARKALALHYLSGTWRYDHGFWRQAATALQAVYDIHPDYAAGCGARGEPRTASDVRSLLYASYLASSRASLAQDRLLEAHKAAQAALELMPDQNEAKELLEQIRVKLPLPPLTGAPAASKYIEVSIPKQRMYVWQGDKMLYDWACSTGGPGHDTRAGQFRVLDKIPEAWASTWSLRMPYWLGIYPVGSLENGIHALPILPNGGTLWAGYLGTPVSYGCIILSTENARTLYDWADVGTPVWIHR